MGLKPGSWKNKLDAQGHSALHAFVGDVKNFGSLLARVLRKGIALNDVVLVMNHTEKIPGTDVSKWEAFSASRAGFAAVRAFLPVLEARGSQLHLVELAFNNHVHKGATMPNPGETWNILHVQQAAPPFMPVGRLQLMGDPAKLAAYASFGLVLHEGKLPRGTAPPKGFKEKLAVEIACGQRAGASTVYPVSTFKWMDDPEMVKFISARYTNIA
ncbi:hypothetical protein T492DRAFT_1095348 [Pavlovales sp. CCMP2436]|nr:hypothetical protein T492DRAFT_1095348 [Pavlovales sp. CCMP2436]